MKLAIACDHAGVSVKEYLKQRLAGKHEVLDLGTHDTATSVDYPDFAAAVGHAISSRQAERGVLICGTGIGMSIAANKIQGVRAAVVHNAQTAELARKHNDANVVCVGARVLELPIIGDIVETFLSTPFEGGRHQPRIDKIAQLERPKQ